ncbi:MAG: hypothetical protein Q4F39_02360 [Bacteroidia bacterium]|nr:hypothetical protein [Bacteroidia bacterium]
MTEFNEDDLRFVASRYDKERFNTRKAISRFNEATAAEGCHRRRWWTTAAAAAASVAIAFAAGVGIVSTIKNARQAEPLQQEIVVLNPDVAVTHEFVYEDAPISDVLNELSAYYHCTLTTGQTDRRLTATFPDDDIDFIVSLIEKALSIDITVER